MHSFSELSTAAWIDTLRIAPDTVGTTRLAPHKSTSDQITLALHDVLSEPASDALRHAFFDSGSVSVSACSQAVNTGAASAPEKLWCCSDLSMR
eukprot:6171945-Amphidinium_carterae.1